MPSMKQGREASPSLLCKFPQFVHSYELLNDSSPCTNWWKVFQDTKAPRSYPAHVCYTSMLCIYILYTHTQLCYTLFMCNFYTHVVYTYTFFLCIYPTQSKKLSERVLTLPISKERGFLLHRGLPYPLKQLRSYALSASVQAKASIPVCPTVSFSIRLPSSAMLIAAFKSLSR